MKLAHDYFYGYKISDYGVANGYLDYATLAKAINIVLCNEIPAVFGYEMEHISGFIDYATDIEELETEIEELEEKQDSLNSDKCDKWAKLEMEIQDRKEIIQEKQVEIEGLWEQETYIPEIFQYYLTDYAGAEILQEVGEVVFYIKKLDLYVWGVTHYGTSWNYVLTDIPCNCGYDND